MADHCCRKCCTGVVKMADHCCRNLYRGMLKMADHCCRNLYRGMLKMAYPFKVNCVNFLPSKNAQRTLEKLTLNSSI